MTERWNSFARLLYVSRAFFHLPSKALELDQRNSTSDLHKTERSTNDGFFIRDIFEKTSGALCYGASPGT